VLGCSELDDGREEKLRGRVPKIHRHDGEEVRELPAVNSNKKTLNIALPITGI
jgi:hypothetical protein